MKVGGDAAFLFAAYHGASWPTVTAAGDGDQFDGSSTTCIDGMRAGHTIVAGVEQVANRWRGIGCVVFDPCIKGFLHGVKVDLNDTVRPFAAGEGDVLICRAMDM